MLISRADTSFKHRGWSINPNISAQHLKSPFSPRFLLLSPLRTWWVHLFGRDHSLSCTVRSSSLCISSDVCSVMNSGLLSLQTTRSVWGSSSWKWKALHWTGGLCKNTKFLLTNCGLWKAPTSPRWLPDRFCFHPCVFLWAPTIPSPGSDGSLITSDVKDKSVDNSWDLTRSWNLSQPVSKVCFVNLPSRQNKSLSHSCSVFFYPP